MKIVKFITEILKSFGYAVNGIIYSLKTQRNAKIHLFAGLVIVAIGFYFEIKQAEWLFIIIAIFLVWFAELVNTAFEYLCDVVSPEFNKSVKHAKDIAAGAVLILAIASVIIGLVIFIPYIIQ